MVEAAAQDPFRSSYGLEYWLRRCEGFQVESPAGRLGTVRGVRFAGDSQPELLEVQTGLLLHHLRLIAVTEVNEILPEKRLVRLTAAPRPAADE